ncbi:MAG: mechanosensitive ion channel family protein [Chloroflexota bacterium]
MPSLQAILSATVLFLIFLFLGYLLRSLIGNVAVPWSGRRGLPFTEALLRSLGGLAPVWLALLGIAGAARLLLLSPEITESTDQVLRAIWIVTLAILALRLLGWGLRVYGARGEEARPVAGIVERIGQLVIVVVALLMLLRTLFPLLDITPLLTGLGVAGLATALALQDTLANFFAGLYLLADKPVRVADFVRLSDGNEGYVLDVGWRSTRLRTLSNNVIVIPNQKLAQSTVVNYGLPEARMGASVLVNVGYEWDPDHIERVLTEVAVAAADEVDGMLGEPPPVTRLNPGFGDFALQFTLNYQVRSFVDQYYVQHELRKRIFARFRAEGIPFAVPTRPIQLSPGVPGERVDGPPRPAPGG